MNTCIPHFVGSMGALRLWVEERNYAGFEPYDLLNSPYLAGLWERSTALSSVVIQLGRRVAGSGLRQLLQVPPSCNPKALGLFLSGYCDLAHCGGDFRTEAKSLQTQLQRLRAPGEKEYCWGYDWNFASMRGGVLPAFAPNSVATVFCAEALLDRADGFEGSEGEEMAISACRFCVTRLNRSVDQADELCFSYTPQDRTLILNNSVLVGALLARVGARTGNDEFFHIAQRTMRYLTAQQRSDGAWTYGAGALQKWVDGFHTGYNLCALAAYRRQTGDTSFDECMLRGYEFYKTNCFSAEGIPKYFEDSLYPIDIHACSQAILTFCDFSDQDAEALTRAVRVAHWTISNMRAGDGSFYYQKHRFWTNRTPYMRWAQAWMFRALARLIAVLKTNAKATYKLP